MNFLQIVPNGRELIGKRQQIVGRCLQAIHRRRYFPAKACVNRTQLATILDLIQQRSITTIIGIIAGIVIIILKKTAIFIKEIRRLQAAP